MSCMNVEGTVDTRRTLYRHQEAIASDIRKIISSVIAEAKQAEIKATILEKLYDNEKAIEESLRLYSKWLRGQRAMEAIVALEIVISFF